MERVRKIIYKEKEILILNYSGGKGSELNVVFDEAKKLIQAENKQVAILSIFGDATYISPSFMSHVKKELPGVDKLIIKQAIIGLSPIQLWILKGMNLWYKRQIIHFNTEQGALDYLVR